MSVTKEIDGKHILKNDNSMSEVEQLKQFMEPWEYAQMIDELKNRKNTNVSRKQCVVAAVENQLEEISKAFPKRKIGLVVFNDDVTVIGDGSREPIVVAGDKLKNYEVSKEIISLN
jgi:hypothetical protein